MVSLSTGSRSGCSSDVVHGYVSLAAAREAYGVVIRYLGRPEQIVRLPEHYALDRGGHRRATKPPGCVASVGRGGL